MAAFIVAIYMLTRFLDTRRPKWMALCGVATAVAIDIRVAGVFLVVLVVGSVLADALRRPPRPGSESAGSHGSSDTLVALGAFAATAAPLTILLWPCTCLSRRRATPSAPPAPAPPSHTCRSIRRCTACGGTVPRSCT